MKWTTLSESLVVAFFLFQDVYSNVIVNKTEIDGVCAAGPLVNIGGTKYETFKDCDKTPVREKCLICCNAGFELDIKDNPECMLDKTWNPAKTSCSHSSTCMLHPPRVNYHIRNGATKEMVLIAVRTCERDGGKLHYGSVFELGKKLPFFTVYDFTKRNTEIADDLPQTIGWQEFRCTQDNLHANQLTNKLYERNRRDEITARGHLANLADFRFTKHSAVSTFKFINAVPQDEYSNQTPWNHREQMLRKMMSEKQEESGELFMDGEVRGGIVLTGSSLTKYRNENEFPIPNLIWKLVCTRTIIRDQIYWTVAGFFHTNAKTITNDEKSERKEEVRRFHTQEHITNTLQIVDGTQLWNDAAKFYVNEPEIYKVITEKCIRAPMIHQFWGKQNEKLPRYRELEEFDEDHISKETQAEYKDEINDEDYYDQ